jgi:epoxide hydrolase-like predicted phosphatase
MLTSRHRTIPHMTERRSVADDGLTALVVDWGGVLTQPLQDTMRAWCETDSIDADDFARAMKDWLGEPYGDEARVNPVHALERGEMEVPHFEAELAKRLRTHDGRPVEAEGLLSRMFSGFGREPAMAGVVRRARQQGIRTALLSNSWGLDYPREGWDQMFDVVVISGEVGMRKPEPAIYRHTATLLGVEPQECVFVDDLRPNVRGAVDVGMVGVHHVTPEETIVELEALFGVQLGDGHG